MSERSVRDCPVCGTPASAARLFVRERLDPTRLNEFSFASRKEPEFLSHRMVRCRSCDLVFVDAPPSQNALASAYHQADYDSATEADDAASSYLSAIQPVLARLARRDAALEIGTGSGAFLEALSRVGFSELVGVEPSPAAIAAAPVGRRHWIREAIFREEDFKPGSFDLICCFMTLEHVQDPSSVSRAAQRLLRSGGAFVAVTHDYRSLINRVLGRRSPIIDIEHMQLFSQRSVRELLARASLEQIHVASFANRYAISYWTRLMPLPRSAKTLLQSATQAAGLSAAKLRLNVGNMIASGFRGA